MENQTLHEWLVKPSPSHASTTSEKDPSGFGQSHKREMPGQIVGLGELLKGLVLTRNLENEPRRHSVAVFQSKAQARIAYDHLRTFWAGSSKGRLYYFPPLEFDYYRGVLPNPEAVHERNRALYAALQSEWGICVLTTPMALIQRVVHPEIFSGAVVLLRPGDFLDRDELILSLKRSGYRRQPSAMDPGIFAVRGGVVDVFSPQYAQPIRVEFLGDCVEGIRFFEPESQLSMQALESVQLIPVAQTIVPVKEAMGEAATRLKERLDALGVSKVDRENLVEGLKQGEWPEEHGLLASVVSGRSSFLLEYFRYSKLDIEPHLFWDSFGSLCEQVKTEVLPRLRTHFALYEKAPAPIAPWDSLFVGEEEFSQLLDSKHTQFESFDSKRDSQSWILPADLVSLGRERELAHQAAGAVAGSLASFVKRFRDWMDEGYRVHIFCHTRTHAERFRSLFNGYELKSLIHAEKECAFDHLNTEEFKSLHLWIGVLSESVQIPTLKWVLLSEEEVFGKKKRTSAQTRATDVHRLLNEFRELGVGDYIVHKDFGIGRYLGLKAMDFLGVENDYALIEYRDGDKLYVPIYRLNVLQKYVGAEGAVPLLDKLGGDRWSKAKSKAEKAVAELAAELLQIQAKRRLLEAPAFSPPGAEYQKFEMEFPFDETPDQLKAIDDVMKDLGQPHPMDRLVCGDVGYGKTEVAMRAAFRAVLDKQQVAVLVPTTVLCIQHNESFIQRFSGTGAIVDMVSRLKSNAEMKETLARLEQGKIDVIVGTHRLLSADVKIPRLGLVIVDEEHRFGVLHKEKLKKLCDAVHVLSMSATPIPRTLNMAMTGIKDISIISTPPPNRLSVRTFVSRRTDEVIAEAISNEVAREGQVFFVHNRVETIFGVADELRRLLPKVSFEVTHGQMSGDELEEKMLRFYRGDAQVLVTTTIIESGLDIPRANTILMDDAQNLGLAQIYQLRGRVGRSDRRAYCYLLVPAENLMTSEAKQRLQVIQRYTELGSGFSVASHDLEVRGAGDLLGKSQSGHVNAIGVDLYFELLEESVRELRGETRKVEIEPEISMKISASFPNSYLPDVSERIQLYRRLSSVENEDQVAEIEQEVRDRFGPIPEEVNNLLGLMRLKIYLKKLHVVRMGCGPKRTSLQFAPSTPARPERLVELIQSNPNLYSLTPDQKLVFEAGESDWRLQLQRVQEIADKLCI